jgi:hypothetical protein
MEGVEGRWRKWWEANKKGGRQAGRERASERGGGGKGGEERGTSEGFGSPIAAAGISHLGVRKLRKVCGEGWRLEAVAC